MLFLLVGLLGASAKRSSLLPAVAREILIEKWLCKEEREGGVVVIPISAGS